MLFASSSCKRVGLLLLLVWHGYIYIWLWVSSCSAYGFFWLVRLSIIINNYYLCNCTVSLHVDIACWCDLMNYAENLKDLEYVLQSCILLT